MPSRERPSWLLILVGSGRITDSLGRFPAPLRRGRRAWPVQNVTASASAMVSGHICTLVMHMWGWRWGGGSFFTLCTPRAYVLAVRAGDVVSADKRAGRAYPRSMRRGALDSADKRADPSLQNPRGARALTGQEPNRP